MSQEFRDRCARAMGWLTYVVGVPDMALNQRVYGPVMGPDYVMAVDEWHPDTDYNQAVMMRDEAIEPWSADKVREYAEALLDSYSADWKTMDMRYEYLLQVAFARCNAFQIATAALSVLEKRQSTNDDEPTQAGASRSEAEQPTKDGGE